MTTIGFCEDTKVAVLVGGECGVEGLEEVPDVWSGGHSGIHRVGAVGEAYSDGLINVDHVCEFVEAVRIEGWF